MTSYIRNIFSNYFWRSEQNNVELNTSPPTTPSIDSSDSDSEDMEPVTARNEAPGIQARVTEDLAEFLEDPTSYEFTETIRDMMIQMVFYGFTERYVECYSKFVRKFIEYSLLLQVL